MKTALTKAVTHRQFLKMCGLAIAGAGAAQVVGPSQPALAADGNFDNLYVAGIAGVGTASPGAKLDVVSASFPVVRAVRTSSATNSWLTTLTSLHRTTGDMTDGFGACLSFSIEDSAGTDNNIGFIGAVRAGADNTGDLIFSSVTSGLITERMRIASPGNVGIGTSSPGYRLDVQGGEMNCSGIIRVKGVAGLNFSSGKVTVGSAASYDLSLYAGDVDRLVISNDSGNVGIGTSVPDAKLQVAGNVHIDGPIYFVSPSDPNYKIELYSWPGSAAIRVKAWGAVSLATSYGDVLTADGLGRVGIGTTTPAASLHVASGAIRVGDRVIADSGGAYYA